MSLAFVASRIRLKMVTLDDVRVLRRTAHHLMNELEEISEKKHNGYFVDLFVRVSNVLAINMYKKFGYSVYRQITPGTYS